MLLHFYSTKSQLYNLSNKKKHTLWAHPTYLKNYKENYYSDINHNFGLTICEFTPDGKYIIGGADHGKYVVWDTKKFKRKEMIPDQLSFKIFNWYSTSYANGKSKKNFFKPYVIEIENQRLFINRGYDISKITFLENGKYIITQVNDSLLVWDNHFNNVGYVYGIGKVKFSSNNFLVYKSKNELVIHKKVTDFNNDFESSIFKKITKEDSHIINLNIETDKKMYQQTNDMISKSNKNPISEVKLKGIKLFIRRLFKR